MGDMFAEAWWYFQNIEHKSDYIAYLLHMSDETFIHLIKGNWTYYSQQNSVVIQLKLVHNCQSDVCS